MDTSDRELLARLEDLRTASAEEKLRFTLFLNEREVAVLRRAMKPYDEEMLMFWGGYPDAERQMLGAFPYGACDSARFPISAVEFSYRAQDALSHRDFLGALLSDGRTRGTIGDILVSPGRTVVLVATPHLSEILKTEKIGRVGVTARELPFPLEDYPHPEAKTVQGVAASLRLDCVTAVAANLSREKAAKLVESGIVSIDYLPVSAVSHRVPVGCILRIRGVGKFKFEAEPRPTKKGRLLLSLEKYI